MQRGAWSVTGDGDPYVHDMLEARLPDQIYTSQPNVWGSSDISFLPLRESNNSLHACDHLNFSSDIVSGFVEAYKEW